MSIQQVRASEWIGRRSERMGVDWRELEGLPDTTIAVQTGGVEVAVWLSDRAADEPPTVCRRSHVDCVSHDFPGNLRI